ncbi:MAG: hypothetical protein ACXQS2_01785 [Methermicoccaceae archaeon]
MEQLANIIKKRVELKAKDEVKAIEQFKLSPREIKEVNGETLVSLSLEGKKWRMVILRKKPGLTVGEVIRLKQAFLGDSDVRMTQTKTKAIIQET